jgi:signal transduction histidine kinase
VTQNTKVEYAELMSLAVHEFRTPASVIGGYLRMLLRDDQTPLSTRHRKMVEEAEKSCGRVVELVAELSEISKLDRGMVEVTEQAFDLFDTLEEVASSVHEAADREVQLQLRGEAAGAPMRGDLPRIQAAFVAFSRAILREQPSRSIVVIDRRRVQKDGRTSAVVAIAPEPEVGRALDSPAAPFVEKRGGLGLALPIARRVVERHGGRVWSPLTGGAASPHAIIVSFPIQETGR